MSSSLSARLTALERGLSPEQTDELFVAVFSSGRKKRFNFDRALQLSENDDVVRFEKNPPNAKTGILLPLLNFLLTCESREGD